MAANQKKRYIPLTVGFFVISIIGLFTTKVVYADDAVPPVLIRVTSTTIAGRYGATAGINITAEYDESLSTDSTIQLRLNTGDNITLTNLDGDNLITGTYTVVDENVTRLKFNEILSHHAIDDFGNENSNPDPTGIGNIDDDVILVLDTTAPTITTSLPVTSPTKDNTPNYAFSSSEEGTATVSGTCRSTSTVVSNGPNTYTLTAVGGGNLPDGTYSDCTIQVADTVTAGNANNSSVLAINSFVVDTTAPVLQNFTSTSSNGRYGATSTINITATYNDTVRSSSIMTLTLSNGVSVNLTATGSTATLTGTYTVLALSGESSSDLTVSSITSESVGDTVESGNIRTNSSMPSSGNNIGGTKDIIVDTTAPTVSEVTPVTTPTSDNTPSYTFTTNEAGLLVFTTGSCRSTASSVSSGSNTITLDSNGSGASLADGTYDNCRFTVTDTVDYGNGTTSSALLISSFDVSTTPPALQQFVTLSSSGTYGPGQSFLIGAEFSKALNSGSTMRVRLTNNVELTLVYCGFCGGSYLTETYTVGSAGSGEDDPDLGIAEILSINVSDTVTPGANQQTSTSLDGVINLSDVYNMVIETGEVPTITSISSDKTNGTYGIGTVIDIDVTFSEPVTSTGNVTITLETGATDRTCTFVVTSERTGSCNYTVQAGDETSDLNATLSGTLADRVSAALVNFIPSTGLAANKAIAVDGIAPVIAEVAAVSTPSTNSTPSYVFSSSKAGSITYGGGCTSNSLSATTGSNTITFNTLASGIYANCTITITDAVGNASTVLTVTPFTIISTSTTDPADDGNDTDITTNGAVTYTVKQKVITPKKRNGKYPKLKLNQKLQYVIVIKNTGETALTNLKLVQLYPKKSLVFKSSKFKPDATKKKIVWKNVFKKRSLLPGAVRKIKVVYRVKSIPAKASARKIKVIAKASGVTDIYNTPAANKRNTNKQLRITNP